MKSIRSMVVGLALVAVPALASAVQTPSSPPPTDPRWVPWLGCWQLLTESVREGQVDVAELFERASGLPSRRVDGAQVCMLPSDRPDAVVQVTWVNHQKILEETIHADGTAQPLVEPKCRGSRTAQWSASGQRLYHSAELACEGQAPRSISSLSMMSGRTWIDIQSVEISGRKTVRVKKYQLAADQSLAGNLPRRSRAADADRATAFTFTDVKEASGHLAPEVIQAAMLEGTAKYPVSRQRLVELQKAGVDGGVIDLMVALSFPEKFVVDRTSSTGSGSGGGGWGFTDPWAYYGLMSLYAPYAYRYYGYYDPWYGGCSGCVIIGPPPGSGNLPPTTPDGDGRVVAGHGYTRIQPRQVEPTRINAGRGDGSSMGGSSGSNSGGNANSGGSSGVSSGGYSSGGASSGGGDSGRTAVPRPPGE